MFERILEMEMTKLTTREERGWDISVFAGHRYVSELKALGVGGKNVMDPLHLALRQTLQLKEI